MLKRACENVCADTSESSLLACTKSCRMYMKIQTKIWIRDMEAGAFKGIFDDM